MLKSFAVHSYLWRSHAQRLCLCVMDTTGWTAAANEIKLDDSSADDLLPAQALDAWFARRREQWNTQNRWLRLAAWPLLLLSCLSSSFLNSLWLGATPLWSLLMVSGSLSGFLLLVSCAIVPYSIAASLKMPQEVLLSFDRKLLFRKQMAAVQKRAQNWLLLYSLVPAIFTCLGYAQLTIQNPGAEIMLIMLLGALLPPLLLIFGLECVIQFVLLRPTETAWFPVACSYAGLLLLYVGSVAVMMYMGVIFAEIVNLSEIMLMLMMGMPQILLGLAAGAGILIARHRRRQMSPGYSGGIVISG